MGANRGVTIGSGTATLNINGGNLQAGRFTGAGSTVAVTGSSSLSLLAVTTGTANVDWDFSMNSGQRAFFAYWRVGGDCVNIAAFSMLDNPTAA